MVELKTRQTEADVRTFLANVPDEGRRCDAEAICGLMERVSGTPPRMWGASIVGFGSYHYRYASGHEGDMCVIGFSPRATALTLYVLYGSPREAELLGRLGKHKTGKSCLYIKRLDDVDPSVLEDIVESAWRHGPACQTGT